MDAPEYLEAWRQWGHEQGTLPTLSDSPTGKVAAGTAEVPLKASTGVLSPVNGPDHIQPPSGYSEAATKGMDGRE